LEELIKTIDKNCGKPDETEIEDELMDKQEFSKKLFEGIEDLWVTKDFSDFTVTAKEKDKLKEFKVHKIFLATQSSVLDKAISSDMKEKKGGIMHIEDYGAEAVKDFLQFLYTGVVEETNAMDLFAMASKYEVKLLKERTEKIILRHINQANAIDVFCLAYLYSSDKIKLSAFNKIKELLSQNDLEDSLMEEPEKLKKLVESVRKIQEIQANIDSLLDNDLTMGKVVEQ
jgi:hypothetical protein